MKKIFLALALIVSASVVSCQKVQDEGPLKDSAWYATANQTMSAQAGTHRVTVYTTCDWTAVSSAPEWVTVSPTSGAKGVHELTLTYSKNETGEVRSAEISCVAGAYTDVYVITQKAE